MGSRFEAPLTTWGAPVKCEKHSNVKAPCCVICLGDESDRLRTALQQASLYIRWYGPTGIDKDLTVRMVEEALKRIPGDRTP